MNILFICADNTLCSPALEKHFNDNYPHHKYRSAGVEKSTKKDTRCISPKNIKWANVLVFAEQAQYNATMAKTDHNDLTHILRSYVLDCGQYQPGKPGKEYLLKAQDQLHQMLAP